MDPGYAMREAVKIKDFARNYCGVVNRARSHLTELRTYSEAEIAQCAVDPSVRGNATFVVSKLIANALFHALRHPEDSKAIYIQAAGEDYQQLEAALFQKLSVFRLCTGYQHSHFEHRHLGVGLYNLGNNFAYMDGVFELVLAADFVGTGYQYEVVMSFAKNRAGQTMNQKCLGGSLDFDR